MAIKLGAGGGGSNVNDVRFITNSDNLITTESGEVWLKGGVTETDTTTYPDATAAFAYAGTTFSTAGQLNSEVDIAWDGTYFYALEGGNYAKFNKYSAAGVYQGVSVSVVAQDDEMHGMVCVGSDFYLCGAQNDKVYKYNSAGVFQSDFSVSTNGVNPNAIAYDGTYLWVLSYTNRIVYKYTTAGVYQNVSFSVAAQDTNTRGLAWDGTHFWMSGRQADTLFQYTASGVYTGFSLSVAAQGTSPYGLTWDGSALWTLDDSSSAAFKYQNQIGCGARLEGTGNNLYTRIK